MRTGDHATTAAAGAALFSPAIYRRYNMDLRHLSDDALEQHFLANPHEPRIYGETPDTASFLSMRWLRGRGLEIGAGGHPTRLYGNASVLQNDCDPGLVFGGAALDLQGNIDDPQFAASHRSEFDFVIASHVLEHADGFIQAVENTCTLCRPGGISYLVLPDILFLHDRSWMPHFDFSHHAEEYTQPLRHAALHDRLYIDAAGPGIDNPNAHAALPANYRDAVRTGVIPARFRFMHHKHNYPLAGWTDLLAQTRAFLHGRFDLVDIRYGHERLDCHFVLQTAA